MHSGWWGLSRETDTLIDLRYINYSCEILFYFISFPIPQCIARNSNAISSITVFSCQMSFSRTVNGQRKSVHAQQKSTLFRRFFLLKLVNEIQGLHSKLRSRLARLLHINFHNFCYWLLFLFHFIYALLHDILSKYLSFQKQFFVRLK